jgi:hypothetical protein
MSKEKVKVPFTKAQHDKVHAFLDLMRESGMVEKDLGAPVTVRVDWGYQNDLNKPHVLFSGRLGLQKAIPIEDILKADDSKLPAPALRVVDGGKDA